MLLKIHDIELVLMPLGLLHCLQTALGKCKVDSPSEDKYVKLLDPLHTKKIDNIYSDNKEYNYTIKFCEDIDGTTTGKFAYAGVMQYGNWKNNTDHKHVIGRINVTDIKRGTDWMLLTYKAGETYNSHCDSEHRQAHIMLICNRNNQLIASEALIEENNDKEKDCSYLFELESTVACTKTSGSKSLSFGSILCIIVLTVIVSYLLFGFLYNRFILGAKGIEQFPNIAFWRDFGNLVADGCDCVFRSRIGEEPRSYKGLGDDQLGLDEDEANDDHLLPMFD